MSDRIVITIHSEDDHGVESAARVSTNEEGWLELDFLVGDQVTSSTFLSATSAVNIAMALNTLAQYGDTL